MRGALGGLLLVLTYYAGHIVGWLVARNRTPRSTIDTRRQPS